MMGGTHGNSRPKRDAFLAAYAECGNITRAAEASGIARRTHYDWLAADEEYRRLFSEAHEQACDSLEAEARKPQERNVLGSGTRKSPGKIFHFGGERANAQMLTQEKKRKTDEGYSTLLKNGSAQHLKINQQRSSQLNDNQANRQDKKKGADKFDNILLHLSIYTYLSLLAAHQTSRSG